MLQLTFGSVDLVTADGHEINLPVRHVDGDLSDSLGGISVEEDSFRTTNMACGKKEHRFVLMRTLIKIRLMMKLLKALHDHEDLL